MDQGGSIHWLHSLHVNKGLLFFIKKQQKQNNGMYVVYKYAS